jgi:hypothetical protein
VARRHERLVCSVNNLASFILNVNSVTVSSISSFRGTDVESWITSDGRAYLVQPVENDEADTAASHWERTQTDETVRCF